MTRRAKIVCTLGPATSTPERIRALIDAGMDIARLNLSHGTRDQHVAAYRAVREGSDASGRAVGILADLPGPKIRLDNFAGGSATLENGAEFTISTGGAIEGDARRASTSYAALASDVAVGDKVLIDDGNIALEVTSTDGRDVVTRVVQGGRVSNHKGINLPGVNVSAPALDEHNQELLRFALDLGADWVAMSFVRSAADAGDARAIMEKAGRTVPLVAKIEKPEAVDELEAIVDAFDGLMVARGDLGVEMPLERVPLTQKRAVQLGREHGKPVIVATQMLESMIHAPRPTRAETSDVANAVFDGADALMLSGETSIGEYPLETVRTMARIIEAAEEGGLSLMPKLSGQPATRSDAIAAAATEIAREIKACALVGFTMSGATVRRLASHRDCTPLLAFTTDPAVRSQLALVWGVETFVVHQLDHLDEMFALVDRSLLELGRGKRDDFAVIVAGMPSWRRGSTNTIRVHKLGSA
jgi:pyruvate kinase